jgi:serine phosphatase RsbU (regulator of sigma subunit)
MVSVVCSNALYRSINEFALEEPGEILDKTRELVIQTFSKSTENINDGMDISLCAIDQATQEISWSGANLGLYYTQNNALEALRPHKQPIGQTAIPTHFPTHKLSLQKGSMVYLHSDGYIDQFGGKDGKKFMRRQLEQMIGAIKDKTISEQLERINAEFDSWKGNHEQVDDVTVIGIRM